MLQAFEKLVMKRLDLILAKDMLDPLARDRPKKEYDRQVKLFRTRVQQSFVLAEKESRSKEDNPLFFGLRHSFATHDVDGLTQELRYAFMGFLLHKKIPVNNISLLTRLTDLRYPAEWFPATRAIQRTVHIHVGPTNSGKTYNALQALEKSNSGVYLGPLRLLAHEVYSRLNAKGKPCALVTGEEVRIPQGTDTYFRSCTTEMCPLNMKVDVAVIDEIQLLGDENRGNSWTNALLGVQAKEGARLRRTACR